MPEAIGDVLIPPCTPCTSASSQRCGTRQGYQPLVSPDLDLEVTGFVLPPVWSPATSWLRREVVAEAIPESDHNLWEAQRNTLYCARQCQDPVKMNGYEGS